MNRPSVAVVWHTVAGILIVISVYHYFFGKTSGGETYPQKPVQVVVPFDPGGETDTFARIIQKGINDNNLMPQPLVIINKSGGGTTIGSSFVKDARNDGYTMLCLHEAIITAYVTGQSPHGPLAFEPIGATGEVILAIVVSNDSDYQSFNDFLAAAKFAPESIKLGVTLSMPTHFAGLMLEDAVPGARFRFVSTGGGASRLTALMGGHIDASFFSVSEYLRFKENGLRPLVTLGTERHPGLPDVPTALELGIDVSNTNLQYWWFPKGTDPAIINYFSDILRQAMQTEYVQARLAELSILPQVIVGDELLSRIEARLDKYSEMTIIERVELPDFVAWTLGAILVFGLGVVRSLFISKGQSPVENEEFSLRFDLVWISLALVVIYVLVMALNWLSFVWATLLFVSTCGLLLTGLRKENRVYVIEFALLMAFGVHGVFAQLFSLSLP